MGILNKKKTYKKCPYCNSKNYASAKDCRECGLDFKQLPNCSNKKAKKMLRHRRFGETFEGEIVNVDFYPADVSKWKTILLGVFLGLFGAHDFYVGKYFKAVVQLITGLIFFTCVIMVSATVEVSFNAEIYFTIGLFVGIIPVLMWTFDIVALLFNKFKIPVMLENPVDIPEED